MPASSFEEYPVDPSHESLPEPVRSHCQLTTELVKSTSPKSSPEPVRPHQKSTAKPIKRSLPEPVCQHQQPTTEPVKQAMQVSAWDPSEFTRERRPALPSSEPVRRPPRLTSMPDDVRKSTSRKSDPDCSPSWPVPNAPSPLKERGVEQSRSEVPRRPTNGIEQSQPDVPRRPADGVEQSWTDLPRGPADDYYNLLAAPCDARAQEPLVESKPVERPQLNPQINCPCLTWSVAFVQSYAARPDQQVDWFPSCLNHFVSFFSKN